MDQPLFYQSQRKWYVLYDLVLLIGFGALRTRFTTHNLFYRKFHIRKKRHKSIGHLCQSINILTFFYYNTFFETLFNWRVFLIVSVHEKIFEQKFRFYESILRTSYGSNHILRRFISIYHQRLLQRSRESFNSDSRCQGIRPNRLKAPV